MLAWRIPRWVLPAALGGVAAITSADLVLMRRHRVFPLPGAISKQTGQAGAARVIGEARPSPFEQVGQPEIVVTQTRPAPVAPAPEALARVTVAVAVVEPARESGLDRLISKIPLLRRLRKHRQADETQSR